MRRENSTNSEPICIHVVAWKGGRRLLTPKTHQVSQEVFKITKFQKCLITINTNNSFFKITVITQTLIVVYK